MMDEILAGKTVLVVDDTAVSRVLGADILTTSEMKVLEADSGEQALLQAEKHAIDAFLLDIRLPDMNGIELCRALRAMPRYRDTPIIFVTAMDQREVLQWALEAGADDFIQKPLHAMVLRKRLGNLLQKAAYLREAELMNLSLQRYVSPRTERMARAYATTGKLPAPRREEVCILFSDARGFTEMSQELEPENVFEILSGRLAEPGGAGLPARRLRRQVFGRRHHGGVRRRGHDAQLLPLRARHPRQRARLPAARRRRDRSSASASTAATPWSATWGRRITSTTR